METKAKLCTKCSTSKNLGEFSKDKSKPDGRANQCKTCRREYRKLNASALAEANKRYKQKPESRYRTYVASAKSRGFVWDLSLPEFLSFWKLPCTYCGGDIPTVGLDRVNPAKPYELSNVEACCADCNRQKSDLTSDEFKARVKKIYEFLKLK